MHNQCGWARGNGMQYHELVPYYSYMDRLSVMRLITWVRKMLHRQFNRRACIASMQMCTRGYQNRLTQTPPWPRAS